ncbi:hypothetical protein [Nocardia farcinica]|uniref:hypothetical protein n=1 Tax=Nocardia farcinica TaxID=37329 RepID=UPI001894ECA4|nr:hypothetical protein [Nocardia farcinica]MBF6189442.1 hypothetical protein [Nocardia farcinica]
MSIEGLLRLHGHDTRKVVHPDGRLEFVPVDETGAAVTARELLIGEIEKAFHGVADQLSAALFLPPFGDGFVEQCRPEVEAFVDAILAGKLPPTPAETRLAAAQDRLAAARDSGDQAAMLAAHDAVQRAAAEVAGQ